MKTWLRKNVLFIVLLAFVAVSCVTIVPTLNATSPAYAATEELWVGGVKMHKGEYVASEGDFSTPHKPDEALGYAFWSIDGAMLVLHNYQNTTDKCYESGSNKYIIYSTLSSDIMIVVEGTSVLTYSGTNYAMYFSPPSGQSPTITLNGSGSLTINSANGGGLCVYCGSIRVYGGSYFIRSKKDGLSIQSTSAGYPIIEIGDYINSISPTLDIEISGSYSAISGGYNCTIKYASNIKLVGETSSVFSGTFNPLGETAAYGKYWTKIGVRDNTTFQVVYSTFKPKNYPDTPPNLSGVHYYEMTIIDPHQNVDVWLGAVQMQTEMYLPKGSEALTDEKPADNYAHLDSTGTILTLHNFDFDNVSAKQCGSQSYTILSKVDDLTINLEGTNKINTPAPVGICVVGDKTVNIVGTNKSADKLEIMSSTAMFLAKNAETDSDYNAQIGSLNVSNCTVSLTRDSSVGFVCKDIDVSNAVLQASNYAYYQDTYSLFAGNNLTIENGATVSLYSNSTGVRADGTFLIDNATAKFFGNDKTVGVLGTQPTLNFDKNYLVQAKVIGGQDVRLTVENEVFLPNYDDYYDVQISPKQHDITNIWINGIQMETYSYLASNGTQILYEKPLSGGYAEVTSAGVSTATLNLNNFVFTSSAGYENSFIYAKTGLNVYLTGTNAITYSGNEYGIYAKSTINFRESASNSSLTVTSGSADSHNDTGLNVVGSANFYSGSYDFVAGSDDNVNGIVATGDVLIKTDLNASAKKGGNAINAGMKITINSGTHTFSAETGSAILYKNGFDIENGDVTVTSTSGTGVQANGTSNKVIIKNGTIKVTSTSGYAFSHAVDTSKYNGAVLVMCGDDEQSAQPANLATAWHQNKFASVQLNPHVHDWSFDVVGAEIVATCNTPDCPLAEQHVSLSISVASCNKTYDGNPCDSADVVAPENWSVTGKTIPTVKYSGANYAETETAPTNAGAYKASIYLYGTSLSISVDFTIQKAMQSATVSMSDYTFDSTKSQPSVAGVKENATITYYYNTVNSNVGGTEWSTTNSPTLNVGTYYMYAKLAESQNYSEYFTIPVSFSVNYATFTQVSVSGVSITYDGKPHGINVEVSTTSGYTVTYGTEEGVYDQTTCPTYKNASDDAYTTYYKVSKANYVDYTGYATVKIYKESVTIKPDALSKIFGESDPTFTYVADGLISGDTLSGALGREPGEDADTYAYNLGTLANSNYDLSIVPSSSRFTIERANRTIGTITDVSKDYDGTPVDAPSFDLSNIATILYKLDNGTSVYNSARPSDAGTYKFKITIDGNFNYKPFETEGTFTINKVNAVVSQNPLAIANLVYNGASQNLVDAGVAVGGTMQYSFDKITWSNNIPTATPANDYTVYWKVVGDKNHNDVGGNDFVSVTVGKKQLNNDNVNVTLGLALTYNGNEQTQTVSSVTADGLSVDYDISGNTGVDATTYTLTIVGKENFTGTATKQWSISKGNAVISVDNSDIIKTFAEVWTLPQATSNFGTPVANYTVEQMVNAGEYTLTYTVASTTNYDGDSKSISVYINKQVVNKPTANVTTFTYNASEQALAIATSDNYVIAGNSATHVGSYQATITLKDTNNFKWNDGLTAPVTIDWNISKGNAVISVDNSDIIKTFAEVWTLPQATSNFGTPVANYTLEQMANAGEYTLTYTVASTTNYDGDSKSISVYINKQVVNKPTANVTTFTYNASEQALAIATSDNYVIAGNSATNVGSYQATITLKDANNFKWNDGLTAPVTISWTIAPKDIQNAVISLDKTVLIEDGNEQTQVVLSVVVGDLTLTADDYMLTDNTGSSAGVYTLKVSGKGNFTGVATQKFVIMPQSGDSLDGTTEQPDNTDFAIGEGNVKVELKNDEAIQSNLESSKSELIGSTLDNEELTRVANGDDVEIWVEIKDLENKITAESKEQIAETVSNLDSRYEIGAYVDVSLFKKFASQEDKMEVHDTNDKIKVSIVIPEELRHTARVFFIARNYNGSVEILNGEYDKKTNVLVFETDKFSDYAIVYKDYCVICNHRSPSLLNMCWLALVVSALIIVAMAFGAIVLTRYLKTKQPSVNVKTDVVASDDEQQQSNE